MLEVDVMNKMLVESSLLEIEGMTDMEYLKSLDMPYGMFVEELNNFKKLQEYNDLEEQMDNLLQAGFNKDYVFYGPCMFFKDEKTRGLASTLIFDGKCEVFTVDFPSK